MTATSSYNTVSGAAVLSSTAACGYDGDGNMTGSVARDANGTQVGQSIYSYDEASRLVGIETPGQSKWQFTYDGLSRLRVSQVWSWQGGTWVPQQEIRRVYNGMDVVQERDVNNNVVASYTRTGNIGGILARTTAASSTFYGYDGAGNVTTLTDTAGAQVGSYTYDAWGNTVASSGAKAGENPYRFSTKENIAGFYSYGYRFYAPGLGRWINRDPLEEDGGVNLYAMAGNNPINMVDSYGKIPLYIIAGIGALVLIAAALIYSLPDYGARGFTRAEATHVRNAIRNLRAAATAAGDQQVLSNLSSMTVIGAFRPTPGGLEDDISETRLGRFFSYGSRTILRPDFFTKSSTMESQYKTLLHESYHAGSRDMSENKSYDYADDKFEKLKKFGLKGCPTK